VVKRILAASPDVTVGGLSLPADTKWFTNRTIVNPPDMWIVLVREHAPYSRVMSGAADDLHVAFRDWLAGYEQMSVFLGTAWYERHDVSLIWYRDLVRFGAAPLIRAVADRFDIPEWEFVGEPIINMDLKYLMPPMEKQ
jgi:hypothetical protein